MIPKWLQSGIPFQARCLDLPKFLVTAMLSSIARLFR
jgi:hypothetical protein